MLDKVPIEITDLIHSSAGGVGSGVILMKQNHFRLHSSAAMSKAVVDILQYSAVILRIDSCGVLHGDYIEKVQLSQED